MRAASLRAWPRFGALLRLFEILAQIVPDATPDEDMSDHLMRDIGFMDGRDGKGPGRARRSDKLREALRLPPRPL